MTENEKQGEIKTSDELQAELVKENTENEVAQSNADNGAPEGQGVSDNNNEPLNPDYTGTKDTSGT